MSAIDTRIQPSGPASLRLRSYTPDDLPILFDQHCDAEANRMAVANPRRFEGFVALWNAADQSGDMRRDAGASCGTIARVIEVEGRVAGHVSVFKMDGLDAVGYWLGREFWGRGIATRALGLMLEEVTIRPLHARAAKSNIASIRVLKRCGFVITGSRMSPETERFPACEEVEMVLASVQFRNA